MLIVANWKAYVEDVAKAKALVELARGLAKKHRAEIVLAPMFPQLALLARGNKSKVQFASQDVSLEESGAHTGETTAVSVREAGARYAIIGHSERRAMGEDDGVVARKVGEALRAGLVPILCVGERERDQGAGYLGEVRGQISAALAPLTNKERARVVIAYEPVWAIGKTAAEAIEPMDLAEMMLYVRKVLGDFLPGKAPEKARILYGGSVEPENARALLDAAKVNGFLVGRASVGRDSFAALVAAVS